MAINKETIISAFNEKLTLMQWLKTIEIALNEAVLTNVQINKKGNATLSFVFTFEDGTTLESNDLVLEQGESVESCYIENNHLKFVLTNGDVLDAGQLLNGNLSLNGDLAVSGALEASTITGDSIIENMSGYSMAKMNTEYFNTLDITYAGAVKNGNKVTFAVAGIMNIKTSLLNLGGAGFIKITIPTSIGTKLYPTTLAGINYILSFGIINLAVNQNTYVQGHYRVLKVNNSEIELGILTSGVSADTDYYFRWEETFLLSDNLMGVTTYAR